MSATVGYPHSLLPTYTKVQLYMIGIFRGYSTLLIGSMNPEEGTGVRIAVKAGDVIVLPAGTAHSSLESSPDYRYIGVYPDVSLASIWLKTSSHPRRIVHDGVTKLGEIRSKRFSTPSRTLDTLQQIQSTAKTDRSCFFGIHLDLNSKASSSWRFEIYLIKIHLIISSL